MEELEIINTYIPITLYARRSSRDISDIPPRRPTFYKNDLAMSKPEDATGGEPIAV
jgi:hypothetical protein